MLKRSQTFYSSCSSSLIFSYFKLVITLFFLSIFSLFTCAYEEVKNNNSIETPQISKKLLHIEPWRFLSDYSAIYQVYYDDDLVGTANETLTFTKGLWKLNLSAKLKKLFFKINSNEYSEFIIDNNILRTQKFHSKTEITFRKDKIIEQIFDWSNKVETGFYKKRSWQLPLDEQVFDRISHTIELRQELFNRENSNNINSPNNVNIEYKVSHKGKREIYTYKFRGKKNLITPYGDFEAIQFERVKKNGDKFLIWISPKLNYFPIKISQKEKNKSEVSFLLKSFNK